MRQFQWLLVLAVFAMLSAFGGSGVGADSMDRVPSIPGSVSGTVRFRGSPLPGATVIAFDTRNNRVHQSTTTDANGNYSFTGMQATGNVPGAYQIWVNKEGYGFYPSVRSGARVTRADYTGQFFANATIDIAIYFTVIDYVALPNASLSGADFAAYDGSTPLVKLASTGQRTSYASGDDASERKGVAWNPASRFVDNQDGTVSDSLTGLIWLKDAGCFAPDTWAAALTDINQLADGACGLEDGSTAGQWRLPNINELESLLDASASSPALAAGNPFTNVSDGVYWSSTSYFGGREGSPNAWGIRLLDGRFVNDSASNLKLSSNNAVWAVKGNGGGAVKLRATGMYVAFAGGDDGSLQTGVRLTYPRWIDNGNGTVTDTMTGLIWLKQADCINDSWGAAIAAVKALANGQCGLTDGSAAASWRMPNRNEMESLSDRMENNLAAFLDTTYLNSNNTVYQSPVFTNFVETQYYWTSTTDAADASAAWAVFSSDFGVYDVAKSSNGYTLAVR
jgi:Protein of unknown function (DUF1566)/Carboxypeptidase regulatory-like domain